MRVLAWAWLGVVSGCTTSPPKHSAGPIVEETGPERDTANRDTATATATDTSPEDSPPDDSDTPGDDTGGTDTAREWPHTDVDCPSVDPTAHLAEPEPAAGECTWWDGQGALWPEPVCAAEWAGAVEPTGCTDGAAIVGGIETATVGEALARAIPCDIVWVCPGTWYETLEVPDDVALVGLGAREDVVIDASITGGFVVTSGAGTLLRSLTVTGGDEGGVSAWSARLEDLLVEGNRGSWGAGLSLGRDVVLQDSEIRDNEVTHGGAGWYSQKSWICVRRTSVHHNRGGAVTTYAGEVLVLEDVDISNNVADEDAGLSTWATTIRGRRASICGNEAYDGTGGLTVRGHARSPNDISGLDITDNIGVRGAGGLEDETGNESHLADLVIERNRSRNGAGVRLTGRHLTFSDSVIRANVASEAGGGLYAPAWGRDPVVLCNVDFGDATAANSPDDIAWTSGSVSGVGVVTDTGCPEQR